MVPTMVPTMVAMVPTLVAMDTHPGCPCHGTHLISVTGEQVHGEFPLSTTEAPQQVPKLGGQTPDTLKLDHVGSENEAVVGLVYLSSVRLVH